MPWAGSCSISEPWTPISSPGTPIASRNIAPSCGATMSPNSARKKNPCVKVIVADPRPTLTAREADLHLAVVPGGDIALLNALGRLLLDLGAVDADFVARHTHRFEEYRAFLRGYNVAKLCQEEESLCQGDCCRPAAHPDRA